MTLTWPNSFSDIAYTDLGTHVMSDFVEATSVLNGNIEGANFTAVAVVDCMSADLTGTATIPKIQAPADNDIIMAVGTFAGHKLRILNSSNTVLFQVMSDLGFKVG